MIQVKNVIVKNVIASKAKQSILRACPGGSTSFHHRVGRSAARCRSASSASPAVACFATAPCPHARSLRSLIQARRRAGAFPRSPTISVFLRFLSE